MAKQYFTLTGCNHYFGNDFMKKGMKVKLKKEPKNEYDAEAIMVKMKGIGKVGYVANSAYTVKGDTMSAGRLYDKIGKKAKAKIVYVIPGGAICKLIEDEVTDCGGVEAPVEEVEEVKSGSKYEE
ncbi:MAG: HIRAN domain-containing protein [Lachnospiraceae bacterium]|nr:HIRAN domain-containing protein [Lachnospiraceae bacterium]MDD7701572.1 HIRAN domain-containing protein [Lachnospiraceae bacterium]